MAYNDPVKKAEQELKDLEAARNQELGLPEKKEDTDQQAEGGQDGEGQKTDKGEPKTADTPKQEPEKSQEDDPNSETWRQRYMTLQGMFRTQTQDLKGEIAALTERVNQSQAGSPHTGSSATVEDELDDLAERYGDAFTGALDKRIERALGKRLAPLEGTVKDVAETNSRARFANRLSDLCPEWPQINVDPGFNTWLDNVEPISNQPYRDLLMEAFENGNAERTGTVFNLYKNNRVGSQRQPAGSQQQNGRQNTQTPEHLAVPEGRGTGNHSIAENNKGKVWTVAEINAHYRNVELGNISEAEAAKIDAEIVRADSEGRIIG